MNPLSHRFNNLDIEWLVVLELERNEKCRARRRK